MGITHAQVTLENPFKRLRIETRALVDSGCLQLTISDAIARQLGFDPAEFGTLNVRLADGSERNVPRVGPIRMHYSGRWADLTALVFGEEALMGALALEALDLSLNPATQSITLNLTSPALGYREG